MPRYSHHTLLRGNLMMSSAVDSHPHPSHPAPVTSGRTDIHLNMTSRRRLLSPTRPHIHSPLPPVTQSHYEPVITGDGIWNRELISNLWPWRNSLYESSDDSIVYIWTINIFFPPISTSILNAASSCLPSDHQTLTIYQRSNYFYLSMYALMQRTLCGYKERRWNWMMVLQYKIRLMLKQPLLARLERIYSTASLPPFLHWLLESHLLSVPFLDAPFRPFWALHLQTPCCLCFCRPFASVLNSNPHSSYSSTHSGSSISMLISACFR